jgi:hypothetical protein
VLGEAGRGWVEREGRDVEEVVIGAEGGGGDEVGVEARRVRREKAA